VLKQLTKEVIQTVVARLPWGARRAVLEGLLQHDDLDGEVLSRMATRAGIVAVVADGDFGWFSSVPTDQMVIRRYARTKTFSRTNNAFFTDYFGSNDGCYLDIGANIGLTLIPIARHPNVQCVAFEADPGNFLCLRDNVTRHAAHGNVELHQVALFDKHATLLFGLADDGNSGDHRVVTRPSERRTIEVKASPLDDLITRLPARVAAKVDVQGAEPFVIAGGQQTFAQVQAIAMEVSPYHITQLNGDIDIILDYLSGFKRIAVVEGDSDGVPVFSAEKAAISSIRSFFNAGRQNAESVLDMKHPPHQRFLDVYALRT
jgi:FkbM family methyltransferase